MGTLSRIVALLNHDYQPIEFKENRKRAAANPQGIAAALFTFTQAAELDAIIHHKFMGMRTQADGIHIGDTLVGDIGLQKFF